MKASHKLAILLPCVALQTGYAWCAAPSASAGPCTTSSRTGAGGFTDDATVTVPVSAFRFVAWADTKGGTAVLKALSRQAKRLSPSPALTVYVGDLEADGFTASGAAIWRAVLDGGNANGTSAITFPVRGNHDVSNTSGWQAYFDDAATVKSIGGSNHTEFARDLTYSFDCGNSHFVGLDVPGDITAFDLTAQLAWLDADLGASEARGLTHAFLFWHGPLYTMSAVHGIADNSTQVRALVAVFNKHPIVSATFHGHEHLLGHVRMDVSRVSVLTHQFEEFISGAAGAGLYACVPGRYTTCSSQTGFFTVDVSGKSFTVTQYGPATSTPTRIGTFAKP